jgi:hypothetical protein
MRKLPSVDLPKTSRIPSELMKVRSGNGFLRVLTLLALLLFCADLIADAVADLSQCDCAAASSQSAPCQQKEPCSQCSCVAHIGPVVVADFEMPLSNDPQPAINLPDKDEGRPPRLAASIDHPPQLA